MRGAVDRIAADPHAGGLAAAPAGQLPDRLIGQRSAARDDADAALFVNIAGRDPDAAAALGTVAFAGRHDAGAVRADQPGPLSLHRAPDPHHVVHRNAFRD